MDMPEMLTVRETAARAGVAVYAVRRWIKDGTIHAVQSGNKFYVSWGSVQQFLIGGEIDGLLSGRTRDTFTI